MGGENNPGKAVGRWVDTSCSIARPQHSKAVFLHKKDIFLKLFFLLTHCRCFKNSICAFVFLTKRKFQFFYLFFMHIVLCLLLKKTFISNLLCVLILKLSDCVAYGLELVVHSSHLSDRDCIDHFIPLLWMKEERKEGRKEASKKGRKEGRKQAFKEGGKEGRKEGRKEGMKEGRKEH